MQWYNKTTGELQSDKPMATIVDHDAWQALCADWEMVGDDFRPPVPEPTLDELKATALAEIKVKLADSDYRALKFLDGSYTAAEYEPYRLERIALREKYNAIEKCTTKEKLLSLL